MAEEADRHRGRSRRRSREEANEDRRQRAEQRAKSKRRSPSAGQSKKAEEAKQAEEYEAYIAQIGLANAKINENAYDFALQLLDASKPELRNWEWGRLDPFVPTGRRQLQGRRAGRCGRLFAGRQVVRHRRSGPAR